MSFQAFAIARQRHVDEVFIVAQVFERGRYAALVVVPA